MVCLSRTATTDSDRLTRARMFLSTCRVTLQEQGWAISWLQPAGLTAPMKSVAFIRLLRFLLSLEPPKWPFSYSESAVVPEEEAAQTTFSSPSHRRVISPVAYRLGLPNAGRRGTSPVRHSAIFSRRKHASPPGSDTDNRIADVERIRRVGSPVLPSRAVIGTPWRPKCLLPKSLRLAPSTPLLLPDSPVERP